MKVLLKQLEEANKKLDNSESFAEEFEAWKEWLKLFDKKEELEAKARGNAKGMEL